MPETAVDEYGWPIGFFEETAGAFQGEPLVREHQGEYEVRLELDDWINKTDVNYAVFSECGSSWQFNLRSKSLQKKQIQLHAHLSNRPINYEYH